MSGPLPDCCRLLEIHRTGVQPEEGDVPAKHFAKIRGFEYEKGSGSSIWTRWPKKESDNPIYWFNRVPDYVCDCGCTIFTLRNRCLLISAHCENCGHEEPL